MDTKKQISFEGQGSVIIKYHKYTEEIGQKLLKSFEKTCGKFTGDIKDVLLKQGIINKKGDLLNLPPKTVMVRDGLGSFDEKLIQNADFVYLNGGKLDKKLTAKNILVKKGEQAEIKGEFVSLSGKTNTKAIFADNFSAKVSDINMPVTVKNDAHLYSSSNNNTFEVCGLLTNHGSSVINEGSKVEVMHNYDSTQIHGGLVERFMINNDSVKVYGGVVDGEMINRGTTQVHSGTVTGNMKNHDSAKIFGGVVERDMVNHHSASVYGGEVKVGMRNYNEAQVHGGVVEKSMRNFEATQVHGGVVGGDMTNRASAKIYGGTVKGEMVNYDSVHLYSATAKSLSFWDETKILGPVRGTIQKINPSVVIGENAKFDKVALASLPLYRSAVKLNPKYRLTV